MQQPNELNQMLQAILAQGNLPLTAEQMALLAANPNLAAAAAVAIVNAVPVQPVSALIANPNIQTAAIAAMVAQGNLPLTREQITLLEAQSANSPLLNAAIAAAIANPEAIALRTHPRIRAAMISQELLNKIPEAASAMILRRTESPSLTWMLAQQLAQNTSLCEAHINELPDDLKYLVRYAKLYASIHTEVKENKEVYDNSGARKPG